uniref:Uncharacterized protein n=1 Tax=Arundo donax TaxID=35708 RepID=A0A0A9FFN9_ARUDO
MMFPMKEDPSKLVRLPSRNFLRDARVEHSLRPLVTEELI